MREEEPPTHYPRHYQATICHGLGSGLHLGYRRGRRAQRIHKGNRPTDTLPHDRRLCRMQWLSIFYSEQFSKFTEIPKRY